MYPEPYAKRLLGFSTAFLDLASAPQIFASSAQCESQLNQLKFLGFDSVIVAEHYASPDKLLTPSWNAFNNLLRAADSLGFSVFLAPPHDPLDVKHPIAEQLAMLSDSIYKYAQEMLEHLNPHPSFIGWMIPYEINDLDIMQETDSQRLGSFFASTVERLKNLKQGSLIIGVGNLTLENEPVPAKDAWKRLLDRASLDVLLIRDGVGVYGKSNRTNLDSHLWAVTRATDERSVRLWGATEIFHMSEGTDRVSAPATYLEIIDQIQLLQKYSERLVAFPATGNLLPDTAAPKQAPAAGDLYKGYRNWYRHHASDFSPSAPIATIQWPDIPRKTIQGSFAQIIGLASYYADRSYVGAELDRMRAVGIDLIIPDSTFKERAYYPSEIIKGRESPGDPLGAILDSAAERDMRVFLSLPHLDYRWVWTLGADPSKFLAEVDPIVEELYKFYGDRPAFCGWYIPYELCDAFLGNESHRKNVAAAFKHLVDVCHGLAPDKPVMISPYFMNDLPDAKFTAIWRDVLVLSGVDILAMQDSVGALNVSGTETLRLRYLRRYIERIADLCESTGTEFWWNVETFRQTHGYPIDNQGWAAVTAEVDRVKRQIAVASLRAHKIIQFDFPHYFSPGYPNPAIAQRNRAFYEAYRDWYESLHRNCVDNATRKY